MLQNEEFISSFVEEAKLHIESLEAGLLGVDVTSVVSEDINNMFRAIHSIKGTAGFFNLNNVVELSHGMENLLGECRKGNIEINDEIIDTLLFSNDCLKSMIEDVMNSDSIDISQPKQALNAMLSMDSGRDSAEFEGNEQESLFICGVNRQKIELSGNERQLIIDGIDHGKRLYLVQRKLNADFITKGVSAVDFLKGIQSIGDMVQCSAGLEEAGGNEVSTDDISFKCMFLSILEKGFLSDAIDVSEQEICELSLDIESKQVKQRPVKKADNGKVPEKPEIQKEQNFDKTSPVRRKSGLNVEDSIRVNVTLLNNLLNLASEMVLGRNQLLRAVEYYRKNIPGIDPILQNVDHITSDLQETIMQTRMQPVANVFNKFPRIIRDLSKKLGKEIELQMDGVDVELDKSIIESLADPLTHLVRNAADHGLEHPEDRESAGKSRAGTITLKAYHEGGFVNIDVTDDGKGIDVEKIMEKSLENRLMNKNEVEMLGEQEILQFLFKPGFSTSNEVTDLSGRGVGMDVVKTNIEKLGGTIEIFTHAGEGTTFRLLLPLTLAIIPSLIVEVERQKFAVSQVNLQEIVRIKPGDSSRRIEYIHNSEVIRLRGRLLPIVHLADVLGLQRTYIDPVTGERKTERRKTLYDQRRGDVYVSRTDAGSNVDSACNRLSNANVVRILVIKVGSRRFGLIVDMIHESEEILVKSLPRFIKDSKCYSGVTIMGDGKIAMILDPEGIVQKASLRFIEGLEQKDKMDEVLSIEKMKEQANMLIFKCSGSELFGLDLSLVSRVEEISPDAVEHIGDREYIKFRGNSLRVVRIEDFLPVNSKKNNKGRLFVIIPKLIKKPMGILVEKIQDTVQADIQLDQQSIKAQGLLGSFIHDNSIILLVNIYELFELVDPEQYKIEYSARGTERNRILLVEDTPFFLKMELSYLQSAGYSVLTACNGKQALQILQKEKVDIVVSDINMPFMDGLELVRKIRSDKNLARLPVIAVTSLTSEKQVKEGMEAGFDYYEFKLDRSSLLEKVELALKKRR